MHIAAAAFSAPRSPKFGKPQHGSCRTPDTSRLVSLSLTLSCALAELLPFTCCLMLRQVKTRQMQEGNPYLGVDCNDVGTNDMREQVSQQPGSFALDCSQSC